MATRTELVVQVAMMERMQMVERQKVAKKKRAQQVKMYNQYENRMSKNGGKKAKKNLTNGTDVVKSKRRLKFTDSIVLLEAAARNDLVEGNIFGLLIVHTRN